MRPWRTHDDQLQRHGQRGFNAATAMRPWRTSLLVAPTIKRSKLQCGHGDEAVENSGSGGGSNCHTPLQCGHGDEAVENDRATLSARSGEALLQCGHGDEAVENVAADSSPGRAPLLQCGHGDEAVENFSNPRGEVALTQLQCGHGDEAVENIVCASTLA